MLFDNPDVSGDSFLNWRCVGPTENQYNATVLYMHGYTG